MAAVEPLATAAPETVEAPLSAPTADELGSKGSNLARADAEFKPLFKDFIVREKSFTKQFFRMYQLRASAMYDRVADNAREKWVTSSGENQDFNNGQGLTICRSVLDLRPAVPAIVVGTLFKEMKLRPNLIEAYAQDANTQHHIDMASYVGDADTLYIEDESGRVRLAGPLVEERVNALVSGIVCGVKGTPNEKGDLVVDDICFSALGRQATSINTDKNKTVGADVKSDQYIALISGVNAGSSPTNSLMTDLAFDYIAGMLGGQVDAELASKVTRVVIAGDSVLTPKDETMKYAENIGKTTVGHKEQSVMALKEFDALVSQLAALVPVDIMPGANDPSNYLMPQQPLYRHLFPQSARYSSTHFTTNPYHAHVGKLDVLGTSGQNVDDISKLTSGLSPMQRLRATLDWQHIAPTCPDTLSSYPFYEKDPFIIEDTPHVYFAGNQEKFETELVQGPEGLTCRLICIPNFATTHTIVLVNVATLECHPVTFSGTGAVDDDSEGKQGGEEEANAGQSSGDKMDTSK